MRNARYMLMPLLMFAAVMCVLDMEGQRTTIRRLKGESTLQPQDASADTLAGADTLLVFRGYEKTLRATRETVFVTNTSAVPLRTVAFTVTYLDVAGRPIHARRVEEPLDLPAGETRRLDFPAWDRQHTYYYIHGQHPRTGATPYTVTFSAPAAFTHGTR